MAAETAAQALASSPALLASLAQQLAELNRLYEQINARLGEKKQALLNQNLDELEVADQALRALGKTLWQVDKTRRQTSSQLETLFNLPLQSKLEVLLEAIKPSEPAAFNELKPLHQTLRIHLQTFANLRIEVEHMLYASLDWVARSVAIIHQAVEGEPHQASAYKAPVFNAAGHW